MEELIKKIKSLKRYDITPSYDGVKEDQYENGEYVKWSDIEKILGV
jgi:hypothetical protein